MTKAAFYKLREDGKRVKPETPITVMFNPDSYSLSSSASYTASSGPTHKELLQLGSIKARTLSMNLLFDALNKPNDLMNIAASSTVLGDVFRNKLKDVREEIEKFRSMIELVPSSDPKKSDSPPPIVEFTWGGFSFKGVVDSFREEYTMFHNDGRPARATVAISLTEYVFSNKASVSSKGGAAAEAAGEALMSAQMKGLQESAESAVRAIV